MAAMLKMSSRSMAVRSAPARPARRANLQVVASKGGEEGGKTFDKSVFGSLASNANYALLASAITKAGLEETLKGPGPFTLFAPNDDAFGDAARSLKISKIELLALPNLGDILKYHVIAGTVLSSDLKEGMEATTVLGKTVKVTLAGGAKINGVKVKKADVKASNGIIHVIDAVLIPK